MDRDENSFYAAWNSGLEWPQLFASKKMATDRAHALAKDSVGRPTHLMVIKSIGTVTYPGTPITTDDLEGTT